MTITSKILVLPGSVRSGSFNVRLAAVAALELADKGADVTRVSLEDYPLPILGQDFERTGGIPDNAMKLGRMIALHAGILICSPEYNSSIPPLLKNAIDWVSRIRSDGGKPFRPWKDRTVALAAASDGRFGGMRCLTHLRSVMMSVGAQVVTEQVSLAGASKAFAQDGSLIDDRAQIALSDTCRSLIDHCAAYAMR